MFGWNKLYTNQDVEEDMFSDLMPAREKEPSAGSSFTGESGDTTSESHF